jgi:hypothetical protein
MTYFYTCEKCLASTMVDTDDEQFAKKRLARFQKIHNCRSKEKHEPLNTRLASADQGGILHAGEGRH